VVWHCSGLKTLLVPRFREWALPVTIRYAVGSSKIAAVPEHGSTRADAQSAPPANVMRDAIEDVLLKHTPTS